MPRKSLLDDAYADNLGNDPGLGREHAAKLVRQMIDLGISVYHPDPVAAIEEPKRKGAA